MDRFVYSREEKSAVPVDFHHAVPERDGADVENEDVRNVRVTGEEPGDKGRCQEKQAGDGEAVDKCEPHRAGFRFVNAIEPSRPVRTPSLIYIICKL